MQRTSDPLPLLETSHILVSCEGAMEQIAINKLLEAGALVFSADQVIDITRKRKASEIQEEYLRYEYDWPVCIVRVLDSLRERFKLGSLYSSRFPVVSVYTRPEIEMLAIIRNGCFADYAKVKSSVKPSQYCKDVLGLRRIKSSEFLDRYWDAESLGEAAKEYRRLAHLERGELCLADILK